MSLLRLFRPSPAKQIQKLRKKVKEPHGDPAPRINAAHRLLEIGSEEAILVLLERFTISASPSRQDEEEKEEVFTWIVECGKQAVPALTQFLKRGQQVYWPVRALRQILCEEELAQNINEVLRYLWKNPPAISDSKTQLIRSLEGIRSPKLDESVHLFLKDDDDDVLLAALDYHFDRHQDHAREVVLDCYLTADERPRIRGHILERLVDKSWTVRGFRPKVEQVLPDGYTVTREGTIRKVGGGPLV